MRRYDDQMRDPIVMDPALIAGPESQVIALHGITIPCFFFRRSENTPVRTVLGRVGHYPGQSTRGSRPHHFLKGPTCQINLLVPHLQVVLARRTNIRVTGQLLHNMQRNGVREVRAVALPKIVKSKLRKLSLLSNTLEVTPDIVPLRSVARCRTS